MKDLPSWWPDDWPQSIEEFEHYLKTSDKLRQYLEDRGIYLRFDEKTGNVTIKKIPP